MPLEETLDCISIPLGDFFDRHSPPSQGIGLRFDLPPVALLVWHSILHLPDAGSHVTGKRALIEGHDNTRVCELFRDSQCLRQFRMPLTPGVQGPSADMQLRRDLRVSQTVLGKMGH